MHVLCIQHVWVLYRRTLYMGRNLVSDLCLSTYRNLRILSSCYFLYSDSLSLNAPSRTKWNCTSSEIYKHLAVEIIPIQSSSYNVLLLCGSICFYTYLTAQLISLESLANHLKVHDWMQIHV